MRYISKHSFIALFLGAVLSIWGGCTEEADIDKNAGNGNSAADGTPLTVRATASGFQAPAQPGGSPATRTPVMEGTSTKFQTGDAIGLFCVRKNASGTEYISTDIYNLKMTYTAATDGTGTWEAPTAASAPLLYTDAVTYFAYYPYTDALTDDKSGVDKDIMSEYVNSVQQMQDEYAGYGDIMRDTAKENGCEILSLRESFLALGDMKAYYSKDGMHPNEAGYALIRGDFEKYFASAAGII